MVSCLENSRFFAHLADAICIFGFPIFSCKIHSSFSDKTPVNSQLTTPFDEIILFHQEALGSDSQAINADDSGKSSSRALLPRVGTEVIFLHSRRCNLSTKRLFARNCCHVTWVMKVSPVFHLTRSKVGIILRIVVVYRYFNLAADSVDFDFLAYFRYNICV